MGNGTCLIGLLFVSFVSKAKIVNLLSLDKTLCAISLCWLVDNGSNDALVYHSPCTDYNP